MASQLSDKVIQHKQASLLLCCLLASKESNATNNVTVNMNTDMIPIAANIQKDCRAGRIWMKKKTLLKCDALHDLVPFVWLKKREKHPCRSVKFQQNDITQILAAGVLLSDLKIVLEKSIIFYFSLESCFCFLIWSSQ